MAATHSSADTVLTAFGGNAVSNGSNDPKRWGKGGFTQRNAGKMLKDVACVMN